MIADDYDLEDAQNEAYLARVASKVKCGASGLAGTHSQGCPEAPDDEPQESESPYCTCDLIPTIEEAELGACMACGKEYA